MVMVSSTMLELGTPAPEFELPDVVTDNLISLDTFVDKAALLVMFICQHCPFVKHVQTELARLGEDYGPKNVGIVAISSNSVQTHPQDAPIHLKAMASTLGFKFPYCYDESQAVAKTYTAACTPDFFVFDGDRKLVYRGQLDDSRPGNDQPVTGQDLRAALDAVLVGKAVTPDQKPSIGCNIKWTPGNEPDYFGA
ncbi:MAG: thioredoxin family protein [Leptolyngbya sp. SIO1D8]|nr:thioredoxin family protein [Leptolyngbya sp. SIO1D8]